VTRAGNIGFEFDAVQDYKVVSDTLLDRDCRLVEVRSLNNLENDLRSVDTCEFLCARQAFGRLYLGKLIVLCSRGSGLIWDKMACRWSISDRGFNYSSGRAQFVMMLHGPLDSRSLARKRSAIIFT